LRDDGGLLAHGVPPVEADGEGQPFAVLLQDTVWPGLPTRFAQQGGGFLHIVWVRLELFMVSPA
jgi:hypothetical protein